MLLSVIIPVYNGEKKITRCLDSLMALKESDVEFMIVNDGSLDRTKEICEEYVQKDSRFILFSQKNGGVSKARNTGIANCRGKYISFVDADDEVTEEFDHIIEIVKETESDFFAFDHCVKTGESITPKQRYLFVAGKNNKKVLYKNYLAGYSNCVWNNIYKSSIIKDNQLQFQEDMAMGEDSVFNAHYLMHCQEVFYINEVGYNYYVDDIGSASNAGRISYLKDFAKIYDNFQKLYNTCDDLEFTFYSAYYIDKIYAILRKNRKQLSKAQKREFKKSGLYQEITGQRYKFWLRELRKWYIKIHMSIG